MSCRAVGSIVAAAALIGTSATVPAVEVPAASAVTVRAGVVDDKGAPVSNMVRDEFEILVNGELRPIVSFAADSSPLTLVVLMDVTASATPPGLAGDVVPFLGALTSLRTDDRLKTGYVASRIEFVPAFTSNRRELESTMRRLFDVREEDLRGPSPIWDATHDAVAALDGETGHRSVVLITDGRASGNNVSLREAAVRALSSGVSVNVVGVGAGRITMRQSATTAVNITPARYLEWIADMTGGAYVTHESLMRRFAGMADRGRQVNRLLTLLRQTYTLQFQSTERDGRTPEVQVRVKRLGLTVRAPRAFLNPAHPGN